MPHSDIVARDPKRRLGRWPVLLACGCGACGSAFGLPVLGGVRRTPATQVRASKHPLEEDLLELRLQAEENLGLPYLPEPGMLPAWAEPILVVPHKVQRDIEQLEYLVSKGRLDSEMENYVAEFALPEFRTALQLVSQALEGTADDSAVIDPNEHLAVFFGLHNRHLHLHPGTKLPGPVVNTELDLQEAQRSFAEQKHRAVVIDNFLSEHALQVLRDFLLESTIWTDVKRGYVGAYLQTGLASSLIVQVAEEIQRKLPDVLGGLRFQNAWAYMYDGELPGIGVHADDSQVQINIYVTPTEANMWTSDPSLPSGGLVIYSAIAEMTSIPEHSVLEVSVAPSIPLSMVPGGRSHRSRRSGSSSSSKSSASSAVEVSGRPKIGNIVLTVDPSDAYSVDSLQVFFEGRRARLTSWVRTKSACPVEGFLQHYLNCWQHAEQSSETCKKVHFRVPDVPVCFTAGEMSVAEVLEAESGDEFPHSMRLVLEGISHR